MLDVKLKLLEGHASERSWMAPAPLGCLFWNVTYACNYRCAICFSTAGERHPDELSTAEAFALVEAAHDAGIGDIIMSGGEPFMRPDMVEILAHMAERGMTARIASNGSLLSDELLDRLRGETLTKSFQVSLDTLDPALYGELHGTEPGALAVALAGVRRVQEHGFHTTVSVRLGPKTLAGIPGLLDRALAEGWATVTVHCPVHTGRADGAWPQDADVLSILEPALDHFVGLPTRWLVETYIPWAPYHPAMKRLAKRVRVLHRGCMAGRDRLTVQPNGDLSPCVCLDGPAACVGNVRRDGLSDAFGDSPLCRMLRSPQDHGICAACPNVAECGGGCRAAALALTGRLDGQDESCPVWKARTAAVRAGSAS
ncbi:MAG: radical SAM protein [Candidatus Brocadiaceae bacterium]|nr:radical SAM protein [Candidatus Brocadiaceae bacterium]